MLLSSLLLLADRMPNLIYEWSCLYIDDTRAFFNPSKFLFFFLYLPFPLHSFVYIAILPAISRSNEQTKVVFFFNS